MWSPTSNVGSIELDGILNAWTMKARINRAISMAMTMGSTYSLINFFLSIISPFPKISRSCQRFVPAESKLRTGMLAFSQCSMIPIFQYSNHSLCALRATLYVLEYLFVVIRSSIP